MTRVYHMQLKNLHGMTFYIIIIIIIIIMKYYSTKILRTETGSKCRLCQQHDETIDHII